LRLIHRFVADCTNRWAENPAENGKQNAGDGDLTGYSMLQLTKMRQLRPVRVASNSPDITMD
jgi:hypothetical protein